MSGSDLLVGLLTFVLWHTTLAAVCFSVYEERQQLTPGSRIQYSLLDLFLLTLATGLTIAVWSCFMVLPHTQPTAGSVVVLISLLLHQFAGVLIMRMQPDGQQESNAFLKSLVDVLIGSLMGFLVMTIVSLIGTLTFILWFPIWIINRIRKSRAKKAAAREEPPV
jgi:hypothetical protein